MLLRFFPSYTQLQRCTKVIFIVIWLLQTECEKNNISQQIVQISREMDILPFKFPWIFTILVLSVILSIIIIPHSTARIIRTQKQNTLKWTNSANLKKPTFRTHEAFISGANSGKVGIEDVLRILTFYYLNIRY